MSCAEEDIGIDEAAGIDGIAVRGRIVRLNRLRELRRGGEGPADAFIERLGEDTFIQGLEACVGFEDGLLEDVLGLWRRG